jgi:heavy metal translocating P-type ATPase
MSATVCVCDYCGLPVPGLLWSKPARTGEPQYCCYGCRFAAAITQSRGAEGAATALLARLGLAIFLSMNVMVFSMALWTEEFYGSAGSRGASWIASLHGVFRYLSLLFALPVLFILGGPLLESSLQSLRRWSITTDLLLVTGVAASYAYSAASVFRDEGPIYFEVGCAVLILVTLGRWLEARSKLETASAIESLEQLLPQDACLIQDGIEKRVPLQEVAVGDRLVVRPGDRIPCDGRIVRDGASVDEQVLTGESQANYKGVGDRVWAGTLAVDGAMVIEVTALPNGGALSRLIDCVREARLAKGRFERLADRLSAWFLPAVMLVALAAFGWHAGYHGLDRGILAGLSVLLIACPCALGLATPLAVWSAMGQAAREQVLFRSGEALEQLAAVRAVRLDKTGTLTTGTPGVVSCAIGALENQEQILASAAAMARATPHAHGRAILAFRNDSSGIPQAIEEVRLFPGRGVQARRLSDRAILSLGSFSWLRALKLDCPEELANLCNQASRDGQALSCLGWEGRIRAIFLLKEQLRPEARQAVEQLRTLGIDVGVLTGDVAACGQAIGRELGLNVEAEQLPEDKVASVERARQKFGPVAMVGDGINDAPALARSDVGVALGCGADITRESAAVCLLTSDLLRLPWAVALARQTVRVIRQNLFWAFSYNIAGIGLACAGRLNPVLACVAMVLSSLFVVTNSSRLAGRAGTEA